MHAGVVGLGAMGAPMARRLATGGLLGGVWNRSHDRARALGLELGVPVADDPAALAAHCDTVILSVTDDAAVMAVVTAMIPGLKAGTVIIDTSTISPATTRRLSAMLAELGVSLLDAPVSGGIEAAATGMLVAMVGGDPEALARVRPVLDHLASHIVHMGPSGSGQAAKMVNQVMVAGINQAVCEGLAFARALGLPSDTLLPALGHGMAGSRLLEHRGATVCAGQFDRGFKVALHQKDLLLARSLAEELGAQMPLIEMTLIQYRRLIDDGAGTQDISVLYRQKRKLFREEFPSDEDHRHHPGD
ncbi:MAG: NAD(P)-dependent oxidoreductase [Acidiferrobacteraceae bacterium]